MDSKNIFIPQMKLAGKGAQLTCDDLVNELLFMMDRAYLIGRPDQLEAIKAEICNVICAN